MQDLMSIGRFARVSGLTIKALRLYDRLGLLAPALVDFQSGYRYYRPEQVPIARRISLLRSLHMPLAEIQTLLASRERREIETHLTRHRERLAEQLAAYQRALANIPTAEEWCREMRKDGLMETAKIYTCSFCGKEHREVARMIAGPHGVAICNECVQLCNRIIAGEEAKADASGGTLAERQAAPGLQRALILSEDEARGLQHSYIGTEHLLLGILAAGEGNGGRALGDLGVTLDRTRADVEAIVGRGEEPSPPALPVTSRARTVMTSFEEIAGDGPVGTEHLLLAILQEGGGVAAAILEGRDVTPEAVRQVLSASA